MYFFDDAGNVLCRINQSTAPGYPPPPLALRVVTEEARPASGAELWATTSQCFFGACSASLTGKLVERRRSRDDFRFPIPTRRMFFVCVLACLWSRGRPKILVRLAQRPEARPEQRFSGFLAFFSFAVPLFFLLPEGTTLAGLRGLLCSGEVKSGGIEFGCGRLLSRGAAPSLEGGRFSRTRKSVRPSIKGADPSCLTRFFFQKAIALRKTKVSLESLKLSYFCH